MHFANAKFAKVLRRTAYPAAVAVLGLILFSRVARTGDDANAIPVRLIVVNSAEDAQAIEDRLKAGADFAVLAREASVDPTSSDGGFLGKIDPASLRDELRDGLRARTTWAAFEDRQIAGRLRDSPGIDGSTRPRIWGRPTARSRPPSVPKEASGWLRWWADRMRPCRVCSSASCRRAGARTCMRSATPTVSRR